MKTFRPKEKRMKRLALIISSFIFAILALAVIWLLLPVSKKTLSESAVVIENKYSYFLEIPSGERRYFSELYDVEGMASLSKSPRNSMLSLLCSGYFASPWGKIVTESSVITPRYSSQTLKNKSKEAIDKAIAYWKKKQTTTAHQKDELKYFIKHHDTTDDGYEEIKDIYSSCIADSANESETLIFLRKAKNAINKLRWGYILKPRIYKDGEYYACADSFVTKGAYALFYLKEKTLPKGCNFILNPLFSTKDLVCSDGIAVINNKDYVYRGEVKGGKPHGLGQIKYADATLYQGQWKNGLKHGKGTFISPLHAMFQGHFSHNKFEGGNIYYKNGDTYSGTVRSDTLRDGTGNMHYANGAYYNGSWEDGAREGFGIYIGDEGVVKGGYWKKGRFKGEKLLYTSKRIYGIDISRYQHRGRRGRYVPINWRKLRITSLGTLSKKRIAEKTVSYPISFIYIKSTESTDIKNKYYAADARDARKEGYRIGAYHFFRGTPAAKQASWFFKNTSYSKGDLPPMLDLEPSDSYIKKHWGTSKAMFAQVLSFLRLVEQHWGVKPLLYISQLFIDNHMPYAPEELKQYDLWVARYGEYKPYSHMIYWQLSPDGKVRGIRGDVDINIFNGSEARFQEYIAR